MKGKNFFVKTLGCKVNQVESAYIVESLLREGFSLSSEKEAEILILNSCIVTAKAETETRKIIKRWLKLPPQIIVLTGCYSQKFYKEVSRNLPDNQVKFLILGQKEKFRIAEILKKLSQEGQISEISKVFIQVEDVSQEKVCLPVILHNFFGHSRAFVKVQDGCDSFCSYCIVPYVRGAPRSVPAEKVLEQIKIFVEKGYKEVVLTGIHLGKWGQDFKPKKKLTDLLWKIEEYLELQEKEFNLRLSSLEVNEVDEDFLEFVKKSRFLVPHFHIPLQSGSNRILKLMNRNYTREQYMETLLKLYEIYPYATFGADVIVGFPGESEDDFKDTYEVIKDSPLNWLHIFPFSPRSGTAAEKLPGRVSPSVIKKRAEVLKRLFSEKRRCFLEKEIGKTRKVVLENFDESRGMWKGLSENYISTFVNLRDKKTELKGKIVKVKFLKLEKDYLIGDLVKDFQNKKA
ncbi:MAG: tRNA (N(6)-L-threonylcarbamoyladenosine(37)-C(2))-methylthiotransferase MtaB [Thermodesulfobacterium sp.]|nr:tRNA (N(6)-L-threonylcarbamoyladenosine(37)-C(2))-methylthiotransferase MtaB [Thermodesulfobacterium sp.]